LSKIKALPPAIGQLQNLKELDLSGTEYTYLSSLPEEIGNFTSLEKLTETKSLPPIIGQLQNLKELDLNDSIMFQIHLSSLQEEIGNLMSLEKLTLGYSEIKSRPPTIGQLQNLKELVSNDTIFLTSLPEEIGGLMNLKLHA
jgi:Leucine-rich repeat (LRR) protein